VKDLKLDTGGVLRRSISAIQHWLRTESDGQEFRFDSYGGELDVTRLALSVTQFQVFNDPRSSYAQIGDALHELDFQVTDRVYAVYYIGFSEPGVCGLGGTTSKGYKMGVTYLGRGCPSSLASSDTDMNFSDYTMIHEIFHALGAAPLCAPNGVVSRSGVRGHVDDFPHDVMWGQGHYVGQKQALDVGRDDYFGHDNENCLDISDSPFLTAPTEG